MKDYKIILQKRQQQYLRKLLPKGYSFQAYKVRKSISDYPYSQFDRKLTKIDPSYLPPQAYKDNKRPNPIVNLSSKEINIIHKQINSNKDIQYLHNTNIGYFANANAISGNININNPQINANIGMNINNNPYGYNIHNFNSLNNNLANYDAYNLTNFMNNNTNSQFYNHLKETQKQVQINCQKQTNNNQTLFNNLPPLNLNKQKDRSYSSMQLNNFNYPESNINSQEKYQNIFQNFNYGQPAPIENCNNQTNNSNNFNGKPTFHYDATQIPNFQNPNQYQAALSNSNSSQQQILPQNGNYMPPSNNLYGFQCQNQPYSSIYPPPSSPYNKLQQDCLHILKKLKKHQSSGPFRVPVDPRALQVPDYQQIVLQPIDLRTIEQYIKKDQYQHIAQFQRDIYKMIMNSYKYNKKVTQVFNKTLQFEEAFIFIKRQWYNEKKMKLQQVKYNLGGNQIGQKKQSISGQLIDLGQSFTQSQYYNGQNNNNFNMLSIQTNNQQNFNDPNFNQKFYQSQSLKKHNINLEKQKQVQKKENEIIILNKINENQKMQIEKNEKNIFQNVNVKMNQINQQCFKRQQPNQFGIQNKQKFQQTQKNNSQPILSAIKPKGSGKSKIPQHLLQKMKQELQISTSNNPQKNNQSQNLTTPLLIQKQKQKQKGLKPQKPKQRIKMPKSTIQKAQEKNNQKLQKKTSLLVTRQNDEKNKDELIVKQNKKQLNKTTKQQNKNQVQIEVQPYNLQQLGKQNKNEKQFSTKKSQEKILSNQIVKSVQVQQIKKKQPQKIIQNHQQQYPRTAKKTIPKEYIQKMLKQKQQQQRKKLKQSSKQFKKQQIQQDQQYQAFNKNFKDQFLDDLDPNTNRSNLSKSNFQNHASFNHQSNRQLSTFRHQHQICKIQKTIVQHQLSRVITKLNEYPLTKQKKLKPQTKINLNDQTNMTLSDKKKLFQKINRLQEEDFQYVVEILVRGRKDLLKMDEFEVDLDKTDNKVLREIQNLIMVRDIGSEGKGDGQADVDGENVNGYNIMKDKKIKKEQKKIIKKKSTKIKDNDQSFSLNNAPMQKKKKFMSTGGQNKNKNNINLNSNTEKQENQEEYYEKSDKSESSYHPSNQIPIINTGEIKNIKGAGKTGGKLSNVSQKPTMNFNNKPSNIFSHSHYSQKINESHQRVLSSNPSVQNQNQNIFNTPNANHYQQPLNMHQISPFLQHVQPADQISQYLNTQHHRASSINGIEFINEDFNEFVSMNNQQKNNGNLNNIPQFGSNIFIEDTNNFEGYRNNKRLNGLNNTHNINNNQANIRISPQIEQLDFEQYALDNDQYIDIQDEFLN